MHICKYMMYTMNTYVYVCIYMLRHGTIFLSYSVLPLSKSNLYVILIANMYICIFNIEP